MLKPAPEDMKRIIRAALEEDIGPGDITTSLLVPETLTGTMQLNARVPLTMAGGEVAAAVFTTLLPSMHVTQRVADAQPATKGATLLEVHGPARTLLTGERVALNLLQRMCGVATVTRRYVDAVAGTKAKILDTRKTMPGLRAFDKYAVICGGGANHRFGLYDAVLVKDNHIALAGGMHEAVLRVRSADRSIPLIIECDTLAQLREAITAKPDRVLLDNMSLADLREAVRIAGGAVALEASGGVTLETVRAIADTGVDYISVGALTHSAPSVDIGADVTFS